MLPEKDLPFIVKRIYFISNVPKGATRGNHAHKELMQIMWVVGGNVLLSLDNGIERLDYELIDSQNLLFVPSGFWREIHQFSQNATLLVAASEDYDEDDYIRNYEDFLLWRKLK